MECVILAGGKGERMHPYTENMPKPMFLIGGKPILWHVMKYYSCFGVTSFIVCIGFRGKKIKEYFIEHPEKWDITFIDTGVESSKGERLLAVKDSIKGEDFYVAYGDDVSTVDIKALTAFHKKKGKIVTLTATPLISNFGVLQIEDDLVIDFKEKPKLKHWINGGFFCMSRKIFEHLGKGLDLETDVLRKLAEKKQIASFKHDGFWNAMNTLKDSQELVGLWDTGKAPWKI